MKMNRRFSAFTLVLFLSLLATLERGSAQEQCGSQAGGALCPQGLCCSQWGFCGSTEPFCGAGCQSQCETPPPPPPSSTPPPPPPPPPTVQCGSEAGGALCPQGFCCSKWGFCGTTEAYCGPDGCQSQCPTSSPPPPPYPAQCGWQAGGAICPGRFCCSKLGYCGVTEPYCGAGCQSNCPTPTPSPPPPPPPIPLSPPPPTPSPSPSPPPPSPSPPPPSPPPPSPSPPPPSPPPPPPPPSLSPPPPSPPPPSPSPPPPSPPPPSPPPPPPPSPPPPPPPSPSGGDISYLITSSMFYQMLSVYTSPGCAGYGFYTYAAFITAAKSFPSFANTGDIATRKREIAAFLGQTSVQSGVEMPRPFGQIIVLGYCVVRGSGTGDFCVPNTRWPCVPGRQYVGRGPIQLSYNYNYGPAGEAIGVDLLSNPDLVQTDPVISFKTALWFWMTPQSPKPSCHNVITGNWSPSAADQAAGRLPGYGVITNIINGDRECGGGLGPLGLPDHRVDFYTRNCGIFGISTGDNLYCNFQTPFQNEKLRLLDTM